MTRHTPMFDLTARDLNTLQWYLCRDWIADMGMRSNFATMASFAEARERCKPPDINTDCRFPPKQYMAIANDHSIFPQTHDDTILRIARKLRITERRWRWIGTQHNGRQHQTILAIRAIAPRALPEWGHLGSIVLRSRVAHTIYTASSTTKSFEAWLARLPSLQVSEEYTVINHHVETVVASAVRAWETSWRERD